ncbi:MAG: tetraacyldisaccharide 4'-kinase, partial [candidate division Zixibacteria bacterium]|nr:tetraacyldisaccharide 4'-kinase [candidate division Zixibacteria bacterium]
RMPTAAFAVGRDKKQVGGEADRRFAPDVIIIDDGYQRLDIQKNLDIVVISPDIFAGQARLFPGGILRERLETLERAHAVFIIHADEIMLRERIDAAARGFNAAAAILHWRLTLDGAETNGEIIGLESLLGLRPYLFAGIGSFPRMYGMVTHAGIQPAGWHDFGDHHRYTQADIERLPRAAERCRADTYLTTAKDAVKLGGLRFDRPVYTLRLAAQPVETEALNRMLEQV